jgi:phosphotransferase system enzyme I (PtsI)
MELRGIGVGRGVAIGRVVRMPDPAPVPEATGHAGDAVAEVARVAAALAAVASDLRHRASRVAGPASAVLEATAMMAEDPTLLAAVARRVETGTAGERALADAVEEVRSMLVAVGGMTAERAADVADVGQRALAQLLGLPVPVIPDSDEPFVLVAHDLAPADTALLDLTRVLALVTRDGGPTSHTAILARAAGLPALVAVTGALDVEPGTLVVVDAGAGTLTVDPSQAVLAEGRARIAASVTEPSIPTPTFPAGLADGTRVALLANVSSPAEARASAEAGAEGIGLLRTEFLFAAGPAAPGVAEQADQYRRVFEAFAGRRVVVRMLDAGSDKPLPYLSGAGLDANPALGVRGLRALRAHEAVLRDQLTAVREASQTSAAEVAVMAPMVTDADEAAWFVSLAREHGFGSAGVMAEVPSLALVADAVMEVVDFVSVGTNDLTQYTVAADRTVASLAPYQDPWHPAVLRLVGMLGEAGERAGVPVGVCGEAAADPRLAVVLVGLGATSLSMAAPALGEVRAVLAEVSLAEAREWARVALGAGTAARARAAVTERIARS